MANRESILIVDDDTDMRGTFRRVLERDGYMVHEACNGTEMADILEGSTIDLVLLDLMLPGEDGLSLARNLRERSSIPIVIVTGKDDVVDKIVGLEVGADDYVTKPFNARELTARIGAILRRFQLVSTEKQENKNNENRKIVRFLGWELDLNAARLTDQDGKNANLTTFEFQLLTVFVERPNRTLSRDQILDLSTNRESYPYDRSIDVMIGKVRRKLGDDPKNPRFIRTVRNLGYIFIADVEFM